MSRSYKNYPQPAVTIRLMEDKLVKDTIASIDARHLADYVVPEEFHEDTVTFRHCFPCRVMSRSHAWLEIKKTLEDRGWLHVFLDDLGKSMVYSLTMDGTPNV